MTIWKESEQDRKNIWKYNGKEFSRINDWYQITDLRRSIANRMTTTHTHNKNIVFKRPKPKSKPQGQPEKQGHIIYRGTKVRIKAACDQNFVRQKC